MKQKSSFFKALGIMLLSVLFATQANAQNLTVTGVVSVNVCDTSVTCSFHLDRSTNHRT